MELFIITVLGFVVGTYSVRLIDYCYPRLSKDEIIASNGGGLIRALFFYSFVST